MFIIGIISKGFSSSLIKKKVLYLYNNKKTKTMETITQHFDQIDNLKTINEKIHDAIFQDCHDYFMNIFTSIQEKDERYAPGQSLARQGFYTLTRMDSCKATNVILVKLHLTYLYDVNKYEVYTNIECNPHIENMLSIKEFFYQWSEEDFQNHISHNLNLYNLYKEKQRKQQENKQVFENKKLEEDLAYLVKACYREEGLRLSGSACCFWQIKRDEDVRPNNIRIVKQINKRNVEIEVSSYGETKLYTVAMPRLEEHLKKVLRISSSSY